MVRADSRASTSQPEPSTLGKQELEDVHETVRLRSVPGACCTHCAVCYCCCIITCCQAALHLGAMLQAPCLVHLEFQVNNFAHRLHQHAHNGAHVKRLAASLMPKLPDSSSLDLVRCGKSSVGTHSDALQVTAVFHGTAYLITVRTQDRSTLFVDVELEADASRWRGQFTEQCAPP